MPVDQVANIGLAPITVPRYPGSAAIQGGVAGAFVSSLPGLNGQQALIRVLRVTSCMAVTPPLYMEEMFYFFKLCFRRLPVFRINAPVPAGPDGRGIDIGDILTEITTADGSLPGRIQLVCQCIQFAHKCPDL